MLTSIMLLLSSVLDASMASPSLHWMVGCWQHSDAHVIEVWSESYDGFQFGYSISRRDQAVVAFETLRIERRAEGAVYVASPNGRSPTEFSLSEQAEASVVFTNAQHDFPQRIAYQRVGNRLTATIATLDGGRQRSFAMHPCE